MRLTPAAVPLAAAVLFGSLLAAMLCRAPCTALWQRDQRAALHNCNEEPAYDPGAQGCELHGRSGSRHLAIQARFEIQGPRY